MVAKASRLNCNPYWSLQAQKGSNVCWATSNELCAALRHGGPLFRATWLPRYIRSMILGSGVCRAISVEGLSRDTKEYQWSLPLQAPASTDPQI